jgi:hypothetical protein
VQRGRNPHSRITVRLFGLVGSQCSLLVLTLYSLLLFKLYISDLLVNLILFLISSSLKFLSEILIILYTTLLFYIAGQDERPESLPGESLAPRNQTIRCSSYTEGCPKHAARWLSSCDQAKQDWRPSFTEGGFQDTPRPSAPAGRAVKRQNMSWFTARDMRVRARSWGRTGG